MTSELDQAVWEAVGFGDLWFPPECPTCGPGWSAEILTISGIGGKQGGWNRFVTFPPVHRDWNLAMFAAEKAGLFNADPMPKHIPLMMNAGWEIAEVLPDFMIGRCLPVRSQTGPLAICKAILVLKSATK